MRRFLVIGSILAGGCAHRPELNTASPEATVQAAQDAGAQDIPKAQLHIQLAREEIDRAKELEDNGRHPEAESMLLRADADAELAVALAREQSEKDEAQSAVDRIRQLQGGTP